MVNLVAKLFCGFSLNLFRSCVRSILWDLMEKYWQVDCKLFEKSCWSKSHDVCNCCRLIKTHLRNNSRKNCEKPLIKKTNLPQICFPADVFKKLFVCDKNFGIFDLNFFYDRCSREGRTYEAVGVDGGLEGLVGGREKVEEGGAQEKAAVVQ